uniref:Uncharacterized protein n=1 Tax=Gossypium raimondii TaxID=29730 RepID=A0A0D2TJ72_GOSRA|nr:hypothetical protein B456_012G057900 [Gossypium raimondii]
MHAFVFSNLHLILIILIIYFKVFQTIISFEPLTARIAGRSLLMLCKKLYSAFFCINQLFGDSLLPMMHCMILLFPS